MVNFCHHPRNKSDGKFHLMLKFPDLEQTKGITWIQSNSFDMQEPSELTFHLPPPNSIQGNHTEI